MHEFQATKFCLSIADQRIIVGYICSYLLSLASHIFVHITVYIIVKCCLHVSDKQYTNTIKITVVDCDMYFIDLEAFVGCLTRHPHLIVCGLS